MKHKGPQIVSSSQGRLGAYQPECERIVIEALTRAACSLKLDASCELSVLLCDNPTIARINGAWRAKPMPTDVLSFPLHELREGTPSPAAPLGDIVISLPRARSDAKELGHPIGRHLAWLTIHGLLHLLGYDHEKSKAAATRMQKLEQCLLAEGGWDE